MNENNNLRKFSSLLMIFIIIQPILDIITAISIHYFEVTLTIGIVVRLLVMLLAVIFIITAKHQVAVIYLCTLLVIIAIGFITALIVKPQFSLFAEAQYYAKGFYFIVMFVSYTLALFLLKKHHDTHLITAVIKPIMIAMSIIGLTFVITTITGTGFDTYRHMKAGTKAWFHAGNEIGAILSIGLPIVILYAIRKTEKITQLHYWIPTLLVLFSLIMLGTKVGYLAAIVTLVVTFLYLLIYFFAKIKDRNFNPSFVIITVLLVAFSLLTPYTPAFSNTGMHFTIIDEISGELEEEGEEVAEEVAAIESRLNQFIDNNRIVKVLLSSRQYFWVATQQMYAEAPLVQKLFGMGYAGNYEKKAKLIEMDFLDLFYSYGIIGFFVYLLPFLYAIAMIIKNIKTYFRQLITVEVVLVLCSITLGLGIAFIAGHTLLAPAVSIYLAVLLAYLFVEFEIMTSN